MEEPSEDPENVDREGFKSKNEEGQKTDGSNRELIVIVCAVAMLIEGINLSLAGPFFPHEAKHKGTCIRLGTM